jgi:hypothetical protein
MLMNVNMNGISVLQVNVSAPPTGTARPDAQAAICMVINKKAGRARMGMAPSRQIHTDLQAIPHRLG